MTREEMKDNLLNEISISDKFINKQLIEYVINAVYDDVVDVLLEEIKLLKEEKRNESIINKWWII